MPLRSKQSGHLVDPVAIDFLVESNEIESISVPTAHMLVEQHRSPNILGSLGAYKRLEKMGHEHVMITWETIEECHRMVLEEMADYIDSGMVEGEGESDEVRSYAGYTRTRFNELVQIDGESVLPVTEEDKNVFLTKIREGLKQRFTKHEDIIRFAAKIHLDFEDMHPFFDGNGRMGRLLVVYILAWYRMNPGAVIFTAQDRYDDDGYYNAFPSPKRKLEDKDEAYYARMEQYIHKKYQETIVRITKIR